MSILEKISAADITTRIENSFVPQVQDDERPAARCEKHPEPYGRHFWRDAYGNWNCTECHPPAVLASVCGEWLVEETETANAEKPHEEEILHQDVFPPGFVVEEIFDAATGQVVYERPGLSPGRRRELREDREWWDRADARRARQAVAAMQDAE